MKVPLIFAFGVGTILDGMTTLLGIAAIMRATDTFGYAFSAAGALIVLSFGLCAKTIRSGRGGVYTILASVWWLVIAFDIYTSLIGNFAYIVFKKPYSEVMQQGVTESFRTTPLDQIIVVIVLTLMFSLSPIALSYLNPDSQEADDRGKRIQKPPPLSPQDK